MSAVDHAEQGLADMIEAIREHLAAGDALAAFDDRDTAKATPEYERWRTSYERLHAMIEEFDLAFAPAH